MIVITGIEWSNICYHGSDGYLHNLYYDTFSYGSI